MKCYSIGEVAAKFNIPESTLRYYEKQGLLPLIERDEAGAHGGFVKSPQAAGQMSTDIILSDKNQNGQIIQYDGKVVTDYEVQLRG